MASRTTGRCLGGVIFDMDGVVIDSEPLSIAIIAEIISEHGGSADPALLAGLAGVNLAEVLEVAAAHAGRTLETEALHRSYRERYLPRLRATAVPTAGFAALVTALKDAGVPIGLASSSSLAEIDVVVHALRLGPLLAAVASADEVALPKPAPDVYRLAIGRLGTGPDGVVAIEDSAPGVTAATAAGLVCVGVRTAVTQAQDLGEVSLLVNSLEELDLGTLERLVRMTPLPDPEGAANLRTAAAGPNAEISCGHGRAGEPQG